MYTVFLIATLVLLTLTLLPLARAEHWWIRSLDFPRLQLVSLAALLLILEALLLNPSETAVQMLLLAALFCVIYQSWWIFPYTSAAPLEAANAELNTSAPSFKILTANVLASNRNSAGLLELVRGANPDLLLTLESNDWWQQQLDVLEADYPYTVKCPQENLYGMHVYSRLKLSGSEIKFLLEDDIPSIHTAIHLREGLRIGAHFVHPRPPAPPESDRSSPRDAELVIVGKSVAQDRGPIIVAGDLNDVAWSRTTRLFRKVSGLLDPRVGRGMFNTFHAQHWYLRWPLDHLFHSGHFAVKEIRLLPEFGSDHFAFFSELVYQGDNEDSDRGLEPDQDDIVQAEEKVKDENVSTADVPTPER